MICRHSSVCVTVLLYVHTACVCACMCVQVVCVGVRVDVLCVRVLTNIKDLSTCTDTYCVTACTVGTSTKSAATVILRALQAVSWQHHLVYLDLITRTLNCFISEILHLKITHITCMHNYKLHLAEDDTATYLCCLNMTWTLQF